MVIPGLSLDHIQTSDDLTSEQRADEKIRYLNERLLAADDIVKQHIKVAEEAVSGWEKAKSESVTLKQQLDAALEQKKATDDIVSHLDGALKECMRELRHIKEEQEQRIHESVVRKTRDWEKTKSELEGKLADADQQLLGAQYENKRLQRTVQEQVEAAVQAGQIRAQLEATIEALQIRVEAFEKENASLKYEVIIMNKELEIRNQEREINKKSSHAASRQHLEDIKKINKLEAECQRLRLLVRKKLPGPAALLQMKFEVERMDMDKGELNRGWSNCRLISSPRSVHSDSMLKPENISERFLTMEEETKMLKEALTKRNSDLQEAKLMCARAADRILVLEGRSGNSQNSPRTSSLTHGYTSDISLSNGKEPSHASMSEDGNDDAPSVAESWTSTLVSELAFFHKEKAAQEQLHKMQSAQKVIERLDSTDDFIEMERLASLSTEPPSGELNPRGDLLPTNIHDQVFEKDTELNKKLALAEEQLNTLRSQSAASELNLFSLQHKLSLILEFREGKDPEKVLEDVRNAVLDSDHSSIDGLQAHVTSLSEASSLGGTFAAAENGPKEDDLNSKRESEKVYKIGPGIMSAVWKVVRVVQDMTSEAIAQHRAITSAIEHEYNHVDSHPSSQKANHEDHYLKLDSSIKSLTSLSRKLLHGQVEMVQFIAELSSLLGQLKKLDLPTAYSSMMGRVTKQRDVIHVNEQEVLSDADGPLSSANDIDCTERGRKMIPTEPQPVEDARKLRAEKAALESHMRAELSKITALEESLVQLKREKMDLQMMLEEEKGKLESMKTQLSAADQIISNLRSQLASIEISKKFSDQSVTSLTELNAKLQCQLQESEVNAKEMHIKINNLEENISWEQRKNEELQAKVEDLQETLKTASMKSNSTTQNSCKEMEFADATEKLAECQRTILFLGKQLKDIASAHDTQSMSSGNIQQHELAGDLSPGLTAQNFKPRSSSGPIESSRDNDLMPFTGVGQNLSKKKSPISSSIGEHYSLPQSPPEIDSKLVKYNRKSPLRVLGSLDLAKSLNLGSSSKHGSSFSKFFSRHKRSSRNV